MGHNAQKLKQRIMRRVYYAYTLRALAHPATLYGLILAASAVALTQVISIPSIVQNLMGVRVGALHSYVLGAALNTEFLTLLLLGIIIFSAFSLRVQLRAPKVGGHVHAA